MCSCISFKTFKDMHKHLFWFCRKLYCLYQLIKAFNSNVIAGASQWLAVFHWPLELPDIINPELQHHALHTLHNSDLSPFVCYQSDSKNSISPCWSRCEYKLTFILVKSVLCFRFQILLISFRSPDFRLYTYTCIRFACQLNLLKCKWIDTLM